MSNARSFLLLALLATGFLLWQAWHDDARRLATGGAPVAASATDTPAAPLPDSTSPQTDDVPAASSAPAAPKAVDAPAPESAAPATTAARVIVGTDVLRVEIDPRGGTLAQADLLNYPKSLGDREARVRLLDDASADFYVAQSGLVGAKGVAAPDHRAEFHAEATEYTLAEGAATVEVPLRWDNGNGVTVTKTYVFTRGSYVVQVRQRIENHGAAPWSASPYLQLARRAPPAAGGFSFTNPQNLSFVGAEWYSPEHKDEKLKFDDFEKTPLTREITGGWAAMMQHYFVAALIPPAAERASYSTAILADAKSPRYLIRAVSPPLTVAPDASAEHESRLFIGPKLQNVLPTVAPGLDLTVDYGRVTVLAQPLFMVLSWIHKLVGNWGLAIILLVVLIKAAFFKLSEAQYRSMAKMRKMQPRMAALKERYGDDKEKLNQAMIELYQKEKINPMGGCLPILVQIPVFIALYWVLAESVELRQAPFFGWIHSLSDKDPYFILPLLNGATMWITQKLSPSPGMDPMQAKMMQMMPVMFAVMFAFFPAGLVLYWTVNGILGLAQQWVITKRIDAGAKA
jgi:YidC/Oxa1 family membrane protein insertase